MKILLLLPLILAASSSIAQPVGERGIAAMRTEAARAEADARRLTTAADTARGETARLAAQRIAAAADIAAAEARISEADAVLQQREALARASAARLAAKQAPVAALVAGVVNLGRRPPLVSLAADRDLAQMVRMRALLDIAVPRIRAQSAALSAEFAADRRLVEQARQAQVALASARLALRDRQRRLAALESRAISRAAGLDARASGADDRMLATSAGVSALGSEQARAAAAARLSSELAMLPPPPPRPFRGEGQPIAQQLVTIVPVNAQVIEGLGQIGTSGIRSRGTTFDTRAGAPVLVPADGTLVFAGPFRRHDGVVVIDHGKGMMSLLTGVRADLPKGTRLSRGAVLGKALGRVTVELSTNGQPVSAILNAASS